MKKSKFILLLFTSLFLLYSYGCSKSSRGRNISSSVSTSGISTTESDNISNNRLYKAETVIKMNKEGGVYYIPIRVNGVELEFIFDTGAGIISISELEALLLLKQGKLLEEDILETNRFIDATGSISEGTVINLRSVIIGDKELRNVKASVVHNLQAPLLLGQTALERFGKISIDYQNGTISFE